MYDKPQTVLYAAVFLVVAVVMLSLPMFKQTDPAPKTFGPAALPFSCDFIRDGAGPDDMDGRFTLHFDATRAEPFPHCATLTRGTALRPRLGGEVLCFAHSAATVQDLALDLWQDANGGQMQITRDHGATYTRRERAPGVPVSGPYSEISYTGSCKD